ncbi:MAG TPA: metal ABC transporter permease [Solirubrobacteraceae bacterium]
MLATIWSWLADPWEHGIDQRALAEVVLLGIAGGALGCWLIAYRLAYGAESLAHAMLPGLVIAALAGLPLLLGGALGLLIAGGGVALATRVRGIDSDTATGVVVTTLFGLGALLALTPDTPPGLSGLLFGDVLAVDGGDLALAGGLVVAIVVALWIAHARLLVVGFDRLNAPALGVRTFPVDLALLALLALALLVAVRGLGNLLVVAVLIAPASAARLVARRMAPMMVASAVIAALAGIAGMYVSYHARTAAGASIALALVASYGVAALVSAGSARSRRAA